MRDTCVSSESLSTRLFDRQPLVSLSFPEKRGVRVECHTSVKEEVQIDRKQKGKRERGEREEPTHRLWHIRPAAAAAAAAAARETSLLIPRSSRVQSRRPVSLPAAAQVCRLREKKKRDTERQTDRRKKGESGTQVQEGKKSHTQRTETDTGSQDPLSHTPHLTLL